MMRLYSGTYRSMLGLASAIPRSISGTNCCGSLTNFLVAVLLTVSDTSVLLAWVLDARRAPGPRDGGEHDGDAHGPRVNGVPGALARVGRPPTLGEHSLGRLGRLLGGRGRGRQRLGGGAAGLQLALEGVHRGHQRVEQGLVSHIGVAALLDAL